MILLDGRDAYSLKSQEGNAVFQANLSQLLDDDEAYCTVIDEKGNSYTYISTPDYVLIDNQEIEDLAQYIDVCERFVRLYGDYVWPNTTIIHPCVQSDSKDLLSAGIGKSCNGKYVYYDFDRILQLNYSEPNYE